MPRTTLVLAMLVAATSTNAWSQVAPALQYRAFDVVSIRRNSSPPGPQSNPSEVQRPDGGLSLTNFTAMQLIARAYPMPGIGSTVGLPDWARQERYDIRATSSLTNATTVERVAMLRMMLADRFKLMIRTESREQAVYDLVLARNDRRLGPGLTPLDIDCAARIAADEAAAEKARNSGAPPPPLQRPDFTKPPPSCTIRIVEASIRDRSGDRQGQLGALLEGETTMDRLTMSGLMLAVDRPIVDRTGQLGLRLEPSRAQRETLVIERIERPTEN